MYICMHVYICITSLYMQNFITKYIIHIWWITREFPWKVPWKFHAAFTVHDNLNGDDVILQSWVIAKEALVKVYNDKQLV